MNIIVATCRNRGIGINGLLPWNLKEDMRFFKNKTIGNGNNAVIMGRKTYDSIPNNLPKRKNYVISSTTRNYQEQGTVIYSDIIQANYDIVTRNKKFNNIWVIGGEQIYNWYIHNNLIKDVYVTNILHDYECDSFFPTLPNSFKQIHSGNIIMSKEDKILYNIEVYRNKFYDYKNDDVMWCEYLKELDRIDNYGVV